MQMYSVAFESDTPETIDRGRVLVCAGNAAAAQELVCHHLELPA